MNCDAPSRDVLTAMLRAALLEIRAGDEIKRMRALADIFHNLPSHLMKPWSDEVGDEAYRQIVQKAKAKRLSSYIEQLRVMSEKSVRKSVVEE